MVGASGFEPPTSASRTLRAKPNCATPRRTYYKAIMTFKARNIDEVVIPVLQPKENPGGREGNIVYKAQLRINVNE